ncbi:RIP metalloprotease RseP [Wenyingzhuangia marina]|uniref:Zinc metalloprotease n=1 Tax=Wenyingzhuangia marina TaxID=1195760 RepID=A0A1M5W309_9FLAO|nr:RIP metalloprotease RseP [Wenyingzhuangia marina]GGF76227.1 zinc metalloprotease [Wenyingzhuangia marina]SHH81902.1 regulator of sigma E protease [Wenyingzhuangia marina]
MENLIIAGQFILSLSLLIVLHELGHFIPAKLFKTKVEKFYLFFDYKFSLFKKKIGDTVYGIGWIPLGGYVKISGMIDESMDTEQMQQPAQPWEFRSKPAWQRLIIMLGGVIVNFILGLLIYIMIFSVWGQEIIGPKDVKNGFSVSQTMKKYGFKDGDTFLKVDGKPVENVLDVNKQLFLRDVKDIEVLHIDGTVENLSIPENIGKEMWQLNDLKPFTPRFAAVIDSVIEGEPASQSGFMKHDRIVSVNGEKSVYWGDFTSKIQESNGEAIVVEVDRDGALVTLTVTPDENKKIGVTPAFNPDENFTVKHQTYGLSESINKGAAAAYWTLKDYMAQFKYVFTKKGASSMGGFISIAKIFKPVWDWQVFWANTAFLSIMLGFMNLLPIPALDGGHVVFTLYEMITGRKPGDKFLEYAQITGFVLLLSLLAFANGNDIYKLVVGFLS